MAAAIQNLATSSIEDPPPLKKRRFNSPKRAEDVAIAKKLAIPENTEKATQWCLNTWDDGPSKGS